MNMSDEAAVLVKFDENREKLTRSLRLHHVHLPAYTLS